MNFVATVVRVMSEKIAK